MSDSDNVPRLLEIGGNTALLVEAQRIAARRLLDYDGEKFPHDGCAITLSVLLQEADIDVADTFQAIELGQILQNERHWRRVDPGEQKAGDIGSTCGPRPDHGRDHIYLVLKVNNANEMVIADNQEPQPHFRFVSGLGGKTPTKFFLRAP